jgi:hypothetical protein
MIFCLVALSHMIDDHLHLATENDYLLAITAAYGRLPRDGVYVFSRASNYSCGYLEELIGGQLPVPRCTAKSHADLSLLRMAIFLAPSDCPEDLVYAGMVRYFLACSAPVLQNYLVGSHE